MKIVVTYEKQDILRLVAADLQAQGMLVKHGTALEYKGSLAVRFDVETEDGALAAALVSSELQSTPKVAVPARAEAEVEPSSVDMDDVLHRSRVLVNTQPGKFDRPGPARPLGANESYDFPKG